MKFKLRTSKTGPLRPCAFGGFRGFKEGFRRGVGVVKRRPGLWGGRLSAGVSAWRGFSIGLFHLGFSICISRRCSGPGR